MKKISNIVVSTDFSVTARNAFRYAKGLATVLNASISVVHVKEYMMSTYDLASTTVMQITELKANRALENFIADETIDSGKGHNFFPRNGLDIRTQVLTTLDKQPKK